MPKIHEPGQPPKKLLIDKAKVALASNATSFTACTLGPPGMGLLNLVLTSEELESYLDAEFQQPTEPSKVVPATEAGVQQWENDWYQYNLHTSVNKTLLAQLIAACDETYYRMLRDPILGYGQLTLPKLLDHLEDNYGRFDESERHRLMDTIHKPWDGESFEDLVAQIENNADALSANGFSVPKEQQIDILYNLVYDQGGLRLACRKWRMKPTAEKGTFKAAVAHFKAYAEDKKNDATAEQEGYAAFATQSAMQEATKALTQSTAQVAMLAKAKEESDRALADLTNKFTAIQAQNQQLANLMSNFAGTGNNSTPRTNNNSSPTFAPSQCGGARHQNLQSPLHRNPLRRRPRISLVPMGPPSSTSDAYPQPSSHIPHQSPPFSGRAAQRNLQLQPNANWPLGNKSGSS